VVEAQHLQVEEAHDQRPGAESHDQRHRNQASREQTPLGPLVLQAYRARQGATLGARLGQRDRRDIVSPAATISGQINAPERIGNQRFHPV
jgi:hypothetical protein